ncbi:hypothetical protein RHGRI_014319 [Rhododendron griersonianum]|uniref:Uncharacterized protein n=1 Tax=Rhododendron griersonianum TaxID=479676 RepID=A0AAV6K9D4_9ERIC|nr:hypothetical protein RHGRI_014319 [Rhododendron griersonianum]
MLEGLGGKAIDSNEMRRKQRNPVDPAPILGPQENSITIRSSPSKTLHKPFDLCPDAHFLDSSPSGDYKLGSSALHGSSRQSLWLNSRSSGPSIRSLWLNSCSRPPLVRPSQAPFTAGHHAVLPVVGWSKLRSIGQRSVSSEQAFLGSTAAGCRSQSGRQSSRRPFGLNGMGTGPFIGHKPSSPAAHSTEKELSVSEDQLLEILGGVVSSNQAQGELKQHIKSLTSQSKGHSEPDYSLAPEPPDQLGSSSKEGADLPWPGLALPAAALLLAAGDDGWPPHLADLAGGLDCPSKAVKSTVSKVTAKSP